MGPRQHRLGDGRLPGGPARRDVREGRRRRVLDDVDSGAIIATSANLSSKAIDSGYLQAANLTFGSVPGGDTVTQLWVYRWTGSDATSRLCFYFDRDTTQAAIAYATAGNDIILLWNALGVARV